MKRVDLKDYVDLLESFQTGRINAETFEARYLTLFKADQRLFPEDVFDVLNRLFYDVDTFVSDPEIRGPESLDQKQLFERAQVAYIAINGLFN